MPSSGLLRHMRCTDIYARKIPIHRGEKQRKINLRGGKSCGNKCWETRAQKFQSWFCHWPLSEVSSSAEENWERQWHSVLTCSLFSLLQCMQEMGNGKANRLYEAYLPETFRRPQIDPYLSWSIAECSLDVWEEPGISAWTSRKLWLFFLLQPRQKRHLCADLGIVI